MNENEIIIELDWEYILKKVWDKIVLAILSGILCFILAFGYEKFIKIPVYRSSTKIYAVDNSENSNITFTALQIGTNLVKDFQQIILSRDVILGVIKNEGLIMSLDDIVKNVVVTSPKDTRVIEITVTNTSPILASKLANALRVKGIEKIKEVTKIKEITVIEEAKPSRNPIGINPYKIFIISFIAGFFLVIIAVVLKELIDDRVKKSEDIENVLDMVLLATIPKTK